MIALEREASLRVEPGSRIEIACLSGVVWVTHEGDTRDLFLAHGESLVPPMRGVTMVTALEPATVRLLDCAEQRSAARWWSGVTSIRAARRHGAGSRHARRLSSGCLAPLPGSAPMVSAGGVRPRASAAMPCVKASESMNASPENDGVLTRESQSHELPAVGRIEEVTVARPDVRTWCDT
jgi:DUF2917 family protein